MVIFKSENGIKTMTVYTDVIVTEVPEKAVRYDTLDVFASAFLFSCGTPLVCVVT